MEFKSYIKELKYLLSIILLGGAVAIVVLEFQPFSTSLALVIGAVVVLAIATYFYYALTNYDFELTESCLIARNRFPFFRREYSLAVKNIRKVSFRDDSLINLFSEYKYVVIQYTDEYGQAKQNRFHCHGLEYDCNGDNTNLPTYDDLYLTLNRRGIATEWINKNNERPTPHTTDN